MSEQGSTGAPPRDEASEALDKLIDGFAHAWNSVAGCTSRVLSGRYTPSEAISDLDAWVSLSASCAARLAESWWGGVQQLAAYRDTWTAKMTVFPAVSQRPLTLVAQPLRAIGLGPHPQLDASAVTFDPPVVTTGVDKFDVTVTFPRGRRRQTLIYEGVITARETGAPVTDPIRPNNQDSGPLQ
jgi:hypothetical protein